MVLQAPRSFYSVGGASETEDYIPPAVTAVTAYAGSTTGVCALEIVDDLKREEDETMKVTLSAVAVGPDGIETPVLGGDHTTIVTIRDDDSTCNFAINLGFPTIYF